MLEINVSPYIGKSEEDFLIFCRKNGINAKLQSATKSSRTYAIVLEREFIDDVEKAVVGYCENHNIDYKFYRDTDGNHHCHLPQGKPCGLGNLAIT